MHRLSIIGRVHNCFECPYRAKTIYKNFIGCEQLGQYIEPPSDDCEAKLSFPDKCPLPISVSEIRKKKLKEIFTNF